MQWRQRFVWGVILGLVLAPVAVTLASEYFPDPAGGGGGPHAATHIDGGSDPIDGDMLEMTFSPSNYTPDFSGPESDSSDDLAAHLAGIDTALLGSGIGVQTESIADSGDGSPAVATITPTGQRVRITCNDVDTCDVTLGEVGPPTDGIQTCITNNSANRVTFSDTSGVSELASGFSMSQYSSLCVTYDSDRWVETSRSDN